MDKFLKDAWCALDGSKHTREILDGTETRTQDGDVKVVTGSMVTNGSLVLWNPNRVQSYTNMLPATRDRIGECSRVLQPIIEATGVELPEAIKGHLRVPLGRRFIVGMGYGFASYTCVDPDCGFEIQDGGPLESDGFLGGYEGEPFAHVFIYKTVAKIVRRFDIRQVQLCERYGQHGFGLLKFQGSFKGRDVFLVLLPANLKPGDEDAAVDLILEWSGRKPRKK